MQAKGEQKASRYSRRSGERESRLKNRMEETAKG
jgi:hypothetical protein